MATKSFLVTIEISKRWDVVTDEQVAPVVEEFKKRALDIRAANILGGLTVVSVVEQN
ncbi:MAG TPA: hypothetical protein VMW46_03260 [Candidatus Desulfaltia sp.]|nr:hypothetical protein [Candidatus Desulfaltia sp.]